MLNDSYCGRTSEDLSIAKVKSSVHTSGHKTLYGIKSCKFEWLHLNWRHSRLLALQLNGWAGAKWQDRDTKKYKNVDEAWKAYYAGKLKMSDFVEIG